MLCTVWPLVIIIAWVYLVSFLQRVERTFRYTGKGKWPYCSSNLEHCVSYKPLWDDGNVEMHVGENGSGSGDEE